MLTTLKYCAEGLHFSALIVCKIICNVFIVQVCLVTEKEKATALKQQNQQLLEQLKQYDNMEQHVKRLKEGFSELFKKVTKGKSEAEQQSPEDLDMLKKMEELVNELKAREIEVRNTFNQSKILKYILYVG